MGEIFSDEGDVPERGEDTAMYQEWQEIRTRLDKWRTAFKNEMINEDFEARVIAIDDAMSVVSVMMEGPL